MWTLYDVYRWFHLSLKVLAHLSVVVLKVAQLETLFQFGLVPHPELIESPFCLIQLRQQPERGAKDGAKMQLSREKAVGKKWIRYEMQRGCWQRYLYIFLVLMCVCLLCRHNATWHESQCPQCCLKYWLICEHSALSTIIPIVLIGRNHSAMNKSTVTKKQKVCWLYALLHA